MITTLTYEELVKRIKEKGLSEEEINARINKKLDDLAGLISKEGAAHLIANEVGIKIFEDVGEIKIDKVLIGMRSVDVVGKVIINYGIREFKTEKREGRVASFLIGDETARIRIAVWDENIINKLTNLKEEDIVRVKGAYARENSGWMELHIGNRGDIEINPENVTIEKIAEPVLVEGTVKQIKDLNETDRNVVLRGTIVQLFEPRFYEICEVCGKRIYLEDGNFKCMDHNIVNPKYAAVLNFFLDDGSENIRIVVFRDQVKDVLEVDDKKLLSFREKPAEFGDLRENILGKQIEVVGRVVKNDMFDRKEFVASNVENLDPEKLIKELQ